MLHSKTTFYILQTYLPNYWSTYTGIGILRVAENTHGIGEITPKSRIWMVLQILHISTISSHKIQKYETF